MRRRGIREAVRGICESFGARLPPPDRRAEEPPTRALERARREGLPRRQPARALRRRRARDARAAGGRRGDLRRRLLAAADRRLAGDRRRSSRHGTEEQRERWLPGIAAGTTRVAFAITEPDAGTNSHNLSTAATRDGDVYRLRGTKTYISGVEDADAILVIARKREADGTLGLPLLMLVDTDSPGLEKQFIPVAVQGL